MRRALVTLACVTLGAALLGLSAIGPGTGTVSVSGSPAPAYAACQEEDGSTPGQTFPCMWDAATMGNGTGESYVLTMPACDPYESALAAESIERGESLRLACDDLRSIVGAN